VLTAVNGGSELLIFARPAARGRELALPLATIVGQPALDRRFRTEGFYTGPGTACRFSKKPIRLSRLLKVPDYVSRTADRRDWDAMAYVW
jgi:hypothetical protein